MWHGIPIDTLTPQCRFVGCNRLGIAKQSLLGHLRLAHCSAWLVRQDPRLCGIVVVMVLSKHGQTDLDGSDPHFS